MTNTSSWNCIRLFIQRFLNSIIDRFGVDIKTTVVDDNHFTVTVPVNLSNIFYGWVFSSAGKMKILYPNKAIDEFHVIMEQYLK